MNIGSNNSLTYLEPSNIWFNPLKYLGRCQNKKYDIQYDFYGVRLFDFKLFVDKNNHISIKNGKYEYSMFSFYEILDFLNKKEDVTVLITLDEPIGNESTERIKAIINKFRETCNIIEIIYEHINFCGGYRQDNKEKIYEFTWEKQNGLPIMINPSEWSRMYRLVSKWFPVFIGKLNRKYIKQYENERGFLLLNYVNRK